MNFSRKILTVFSIASFFIATPGTTTVWAEQQCNCGEKPGCDQVGCADAVCGWGACNQQGATNASCGAGGCNQDGVSAGSCGAGGCSQRGTTNVSCGAGKCCRDPAPEGSSSGTYAWNPASSGGACGAGGCDENARSCSTWPSTGDAASTTDAIPTDSDGSDGGDSGDNSGDNSGGATASALSSSSFVVSAAGASAVAGILFGTCLLVGL